MSQTLIVRLPNWLGDTVMAVPALRALRAGLPGARIVAAGPWVTLLRGQGLADVLVSYPRSWSRRLRPADTLRRLHADTAILLPGSFEAALAALFCWRARRRVGFAVGGRGWLLTDRLPLPSPRGHQVDEYLLLVERFGVEPGTPVPRLVAPAPDAEERRAVRSLLAHVGAAGGEDGPRLIGIHLGAAFGPSKLWPPDRIAEFCRLVRREGAIPVLMGAPADAPLAEAILGLAPAASLVGRDRPDLLPALTASVDGLVCGDTGVGHLAAAVGTPVVALFGPTDPGLSAPRGRVEVVQYPTPCAPCFYRVCPIDHPCMARIDPADVRRRLWRLLATRPPPEPAEVPR